LKTVHTLSGEMGEGKAGGGPGQESDLSPVLLLEEKSKGEKRGVFAVPLDHYTAWKEKIIFKKPKEWRAIQRNKRDKHHLFLAAGVEKKEKGHV